MRRLTAATVVIAGTLLAASPARSALVTYDLAGTFSSGPLAGQTISGYVTYDDSPSTWVSPVPDFSFTFNGATVDETTVESGYGVDSYGPVMLFGTGCESTPFAFNCSSLPDDGRWFASIMSSSFGQLHYGLPGWSVAASETFSLTLRSGSIPEPGTLGLLAARRRA